MDPLSVTTGVLTLIAACNALASTIAKLNRLRHAPKELEALETEICALQTCIEDINALVHTHSDNPSGILGKLSLGEHINDARHKIEQIQQFLDTSVLDLASSSKIRKSYWLNWQLEFGRLRQELRDLRSRLGTCICLYNAAMSRGHSAQLQALASEGRAMHELQLQTFQALRRELRASRVAFDTEADKQYEDNENDSQSTTSKAYPTPLTHLNGRERSDDSPLESSVIAIAANVDRPRRRSEGSLSVIEDPEEILDEEAILSLGAMSVSSKTNTHKNTDTTIKASRVILSSARQEHTFPVNVALRQGSQCRRPCSCQCHRSSKLKTPDFLRQITGQLLIGYAGVSSITLPCNEHACAQRQRMAVRFQYNFPVWSLIQRVLTFVSYSSGTFGPENVLRVSRIRPGLDEVFIQVQSGNIRRLQQLFIQGSASPLDASDTGWTLLHYALTAGQLPTVKFLKDCGADVRAESTSRETPIEVAWNRILSGCLDERSELLLRHVFDNDDELDERQFTTLHKIVLGMIGKSLVEELEITTANINTTDSSGNTPLAWASARGDHESVTTLLMHGASITTANDVNAQPIHLAAQTGNIATIRALVHAGADINTVVHRTQMTPIHYAAEYQDCFEHIQGLTELGARIDGRDYMGWTPLQWAAWRGHLFSLHALLQCGADVNSQTLDGNAAIMLAVANNSHECVQMLIQAGADCSVVRHSQWNILHYAAIGGSIDTVYSLKSADLSAVDLQHLRTRDTGQSVADMLDARLKPLTTADDGTETQDAWKRAWENLTTSSCCKIEEVDNGVASPRCPVRTDTGSIYFDADEQVP
ncbi:MAG: hypothetical protein Q9215_004979 [Flavoplaca cf. flavocitrina]